LKLLSFLNKDHSKLYGIGRCYTVCATRETIWLLCE